MVFIGVLLSFKFVDAYTVPQYVCSGLIMFVSAEVLEGEKLFNSEFLLMMMNFVIRRKVISYRWLKTNMKALPEFPM